MMAHSSQKCVQQFYHIIGTGLLSTSMYYITSCCNNVCIIQYTTHFIPWVNKSPTLQ